MAAPWEDLAPTTLAPWESSPVPHDEQDGALIRGVKRATNSARTAFNLATGDAETGAQLAAERAAYEQANPGTKAGNELMDAWRRGDGVTGGISEVAGEMKKDWQEAPNLIGSIKATGENLSAMGGGIVEQIPNMVAPMAGMGAGALAGSAAFGPGAGTLAGMWAGASAGNTAMESAEKVDQALRTAGINPSDKPAVEAFLRENGSAVLGQAAVKGSIIGLVDTITMKLGNKLLLGPAEAATARAIESLGLNIADKGAIKAAESKIAAQVAADPAYLAAKTGTQGLARNVGTAALEPAGEFVGEFAGEGVSTGDWDTKNAALEALSAIGQGAITFAGQKAYDLATSPLRKAQSPLEPTTGELDEANAAIDLPMQQYTDLPGAVPLLQGPPDVIEVPTATGTTEIRRTDGALSAAVIDTGVADALAAGMPLRSMTKQQATEELANRPDADRLQIIPHPVSGAMGRYAIVEKPAQQLADLDAKAAAAAESQVRAEQLRAEEDTRRGQGQALKDVATIEKRVVELNRAAASLESTIKDGTPPADAAVIREQAKDLRAQAKEIHDQLGEVKKNAAKPAQMAPQEVQTNDAEAAQEELIPSPVQPVSEMPATQKVREAARTTAETRTAQLVDEEASVANPEPTPGQIAAGNYKKGHVKIGPLNIAVENPAGTIRKGIENGKKWATNMLAHYGYMKRTEGADGDQVDVYVKQGTPTDYSGPVFVVDQYNPKTGQFDEHKAMIGYASQAEAQAAYDAHFSDKSGPKRRRSVTEMTPAAFKTWAEKGDTTQPVVQTDEAQAEIAQSTGARFARKRGESLDAYQRRMADEKNAKKRNRAIPAADTVAADLKEATGVEGTIVKSDTLPDAADAPAGQLSRQAADFMTKVAKLFGKEIAIVDDMAGGDGLYVRGNTIYVSTKSTVAHLRILGHEMLHALKNQAPKAYAAMLKAVQAITTDAQLRAQVRDYYTDKKDWTDAQVDAWLKEGDNRDMITEEWMADLSGNRWAESSFWESVFAKIGEQHSSETAKGIIAQLKMAITNALNKLMAAIKGNAFAVDARVAEHLDEIREAFAQGFADYAKAIKDNQAVDHDAARARFAKKTIDATVASEQEGERVKKFGFAVRGGVISGAPPFIHKVIDIKKQVKQAVVDAMSDRAHPEDAVWYREAGRAIREYSHGDKALQEKLTRLVAKLSQGAGVNSNVTSVIKAAYQIANGETPAVGRFPNAFRKDFAPLMDAPIFDNTLKGIDSKLQNFYRNLHDETFQENNWPDAAVIDRHAIGYIWHEKGKTTVDSDAQYTYAEQIMQKATAEYNQINGTKLKPRDMQAMLWGWWKRMDAAAEAEEAGEEYKASGTAWNYPQFFERATANITAEVLPSTQVSGLDLKLTQAEKAQFQKEALDLIFDAEGINELARRAGLSLYTLAESTGGYDNKTNPNLVTGAIAAKLAMESGSGDPYHRYTYDAVDRYALAWQYIFKQDGVPWFRADRTIDPAELDRVRASRETRKAKGQKVSAKGEPPLMAQGFYLVFDRDLTAAEETEVFSGLQQDVSKTVGYTKVKPNAIAVINYRGDDGKPFMMSDEDFKAALQHFAKLGGVTALEPFAAESRYHYYDFHEDQTGEGLLSRGEIQSGQRDLSGWISGRREAFDALVTRWERAKLSTKRSDAASDGRDGARNASEPGQGPGYGTGQPGAVTVQGTHYSRQERASLDGRYYGTGMRGAEGPRVRAAADPRLKERVYFYVNKGTGVRPEDGVGAIAHTVQLNNVYDANADTWVQAKIDRALSGDERMNAIESAVIDNGFDGYVTDFGTQRAAVLLGRHNVPVARGQGGVSETKKTETPVTDRVAADRKLPAGRMTGAEWKQQIPEATMLEDDKSYYKDDVVGQLRRGKFSFKRAAEFWTKAAKNEDLFQFPKSSQTEFDAIMRDIEPRLAVTEKGVFDNKMSKRFVVRMTDGKTADVFVGKDNTMWVNASQLKTGQSGGLQLYAGMLNYAHNNGLVLKGDPLGVTVMATFRRTENMLASALKFGTTRHMRPSDSQRNPATAGGFTLGVKEKLAPLVWEEGNDDTNLESLLNVSYTNITNLVPEMKDVVYDFAGDSYQWAGTDRVVTREEWATLSRHLGLALAGRERSDPGMPAPIMAGEPGATARSSTLKRVAITAAVLRQEGGALGGDLLDQVSGELQRDGLTGVSYSTKRFYSQLERQVEAAPDKVFGSAKQVSNWLVANAGKLGIKQDEIQWTGINEFLDILGKGKITKQQVLDYLDQGGVKIEDVMKGSQGYDENNPQLPADGGLSVEPSENDRWNYQVQTDEGEILGYGDSFRSAVSDAYSGYPEYWDKADSTKYDSYTLPGGENYRELLLTLPPLRPLTNAWRSAQEKFGDDDLRTIGAKSAAKAEAKGNNTYKSSHWDEANILAHIRFNERTDADGKRVLFIEEIQSDWGQAGKKTGFGATRVSERQEADFRALKERIASVTGDDSIFRTGNIEHNRGLAEKAGLLQEFNAAMVAMWDAQSRNMEQVPAAPFVTDTKSWVALAMKRMMRYAADNGFEKIAFVNGEQSADRYDLAKQAEAVRANLNHDGTYQLGVQPIGGRMQHHDTSVPKDKLEDAVGKDLANKIISEVTEVGVDNGKVFSGLDLKVGGTGMIKFYNEIVPQVASALLKKMGGKLEQIIIPRGDLKYHPVGYKPDYTETTQPGFTVPAAASEPMAMFSLKRRVNDTLAKVDHAVDGLSNLPNQFDYLKDRYLALGKIARVDEISKEIRHSLNKASDADKKAIYNYLTTRGATVGQITDPAVRLIAKRIKDTIEYTGDQLVARGLLDQQARDHYRDQYLPRMYLRHLLDDNSAKIIGMGKKPSDLGYLKHRKDIPVEIRELVLGEVKDPSFLSVNAIGRAMRDISLMDWMGKISLNNDWVFPEIFTQWNGRRVTAYWLRAEADRIERQAEHYDATNKPLAMAKVAQMRTQANQTLGQMQAVDHKKYKQIPDTMRYGLLRGMYVRTEIYNDIMGASQIVNADPTWFEDWFGFGGKGTKLTQWWKFTKVALNPPGQIRNFVSNMVMLQLSGVGLHKLPFRLIEAARDISSNGPYWKIAKKYGVTESTFTAQELFRVKRDLIDLEAKVGRAHPLRFLMAAGASFLEKVSDLYQFSEALGKTIKIMDEMKAGKSEAEAAIEAQKWLFDYSLVPQSVRIARNAPIGMPFLTYQIKVLPRLMEVATKYPWRFLPWVGLLYGMQAAVASMFGVDDDELKKLKKSLPEWLQDRSHTVFLPMRDADGRLQVADVGYFFPWTFYSQIGMHAADGKIKKALVDDIGGMFSAPIIGAGAALMSNYDTFTHKPIYNESDPTGYQAAAIANYAYDLMAPPFLSSHGVVSPMGLADKKFGGKLVQALGNTTNKFGDPKATEEQAIGALVGFNFYGMDPEHTRITNMQVMNMKVREAEKALRNRLMDRGLGDEERGKVMRDYQSRMLELQQEMVDYAKESDVPQQLRVLKRQ